MNLAEKILGYEIPSSDYDCRPWYRSGSYYASHSEKQLLAYLIFIHTVAFLEHNDSDNIIPHLWDRGFWKSIFGNIFGNGDSENSVKEKCCAPPAELEGLKAEIFVYQAGQREGSYAYICDDCIGFCGRTAERFRFSLDLYVIKRTREGPGEAKLVRSWREGHAVPVDDLSHP